MPTTLSGAELRQLLDSTDEVALLDLRPPLQRTNAGIAAVEDPRSRTCADASGAAGS